MTHPLGLLTRSRVLPAFVAALVLVLAAPAAAGPPLLCFPFDIGPARSLPWNGTERSEWKAMRTDYDVRGLAAETTALLTPAAPVLVRMETLRRAAIYATRDTTAARALLEALSARTKATAGTKAYALALFDLGYLAEAYKQTAWMSASTAALAHGIDGYELVQQTLALTGPNAGIEFAAALMTADHGPSGHRADHLRRARATVGADALLARNIDHIGEMILPDAK